MENTGKIKLTINPNIFVSERRIAKEKAANIIQTRDEFEEYYLRDTDLILKLTGNRIKTSIGCYVLPNGATIPDDLTGINAPIICIGDLFCECIITNYQIVVFGKIFANGMISSEKGLICEGGLCCKDVEMPKIQVNCGKLIVKGKKRIHEEITASGKNNNAAEIIYLGA